MKRIGFIIGLGLALTAAPAAAEPRVERSIPVPPGQVYELVFNPTGSDLFIAAAGASRRGENAAIVQVDGATLAVERSIALPSQPVFGLGINTRTQTLYGTDAMSGVVRVIDLRTGNVAASIRAGADGSEAHVREIAVDEAGNRAFVSVVGFAGREGQPGQPSRILVIDGATNAIARSLTVETGGLTGIAFDAAGNRLFGTGMSSNEVVVVDPANGNVTARWPTGSERPTNLVYDAAGHRIFTANQGSGSLTVLDSRTGAVIRQVPTGAGALSVAFNPGNNQVYVANRQAGTVSVVDGRSYAVLATLPTGTHPQTIAIDPRTNAVYVTNKTRMRPRDLPADAPTPADPNGDTLTVIRP